MEILEAPSFSVTACTKPLACFDHDSGRFELYRQIPEELLPLWRETFSNLWCDHRYFDLVHQSLDEQFDHYYLVLRETSGKAMAIQPLFIVEQDLTEGLPHRLRKILGKIRKLAPRLLTMKMLTVGCSAGEGHVVTLEPTENCPFVTAFHDILPQVAAHLKAGMILLKDIPAQYRGVLQTFSRNGYTRVPSLPGAKLDLRPFKNFDDYMAQMLSHSMRKNLRRKFRDAEKLASPVVMEGPYSDISPWLDEAYPLYEQVVKRAKMKFEVLTRDYFRELGRQMPDRSRFFVWRQDGKMVALAVCLVHDGVFRDNYIGLQYPIALDAHLYFYTWRDMITWAIKNGIHTYYSAPLNYDPKLHLKMHLSPLDLYARHTSDIVNPLFRRILPLLEPTRHDPLLRHFSNAAEMHG